MDKKSSYEIWRVNVTVLMLNIWLNRLWKWDKNVENDDKDAMNGKLD